MKIAPRPQPPSRFGIQRFRQRLQDSRAVALITVLTVMSLTTILVLTFFSLATSEHRASTTYSRGVHAHHVAEQAVNLVIAQIREATAAGTERAWASQPGAIRTWDNSGSIDYIYKLYSAETMKTADPVAMSLDFAEMENWSRRPSHYVDLNEPVIRGEKAYYPIVHPLAADLPEWPNPLEGQSRGVEGFDYNSSVRGMILNDQGALGAEAASAVGASKGHVAMPVRWLYQLADGTLGVLDESPTSGPGGTTEAYAFRAISGGFGIPSRENPMVARFAFWADDETAKLNINTHAGGLAWDIPKAGGEMDMNMGRYQPAQKEWQRYPGHPATVHLATALAPGVLDIVNDRDAMEMLYAVVPRVVGGGSKSGTRMINTRDPNEQNGLVPDTEPLFPSLDDVVMRSDREPHQFPDPRGRPIPADQLSDYLERSKFFITVNSRAPETNLFNQPRVAIWPVYDAGIIEPEYQTHLTPFDRLIHYCASMGESDNPDYYPNNEYIFKRRDADSTTVDYSDIDRNVELYGYLLGLLNKPIPGYGASFASKYPEDTQQILTQIFDYIRTTNLHDDSIYGADFERAFTRNNTSRHVTYTNPRRETDMGTGHKGFGQVVPIQIDDTKGFGRFYSLASVQVQVISAAEPEEYSTGTHQAWDPAEYQTKATRYKRAALRTSAPVHMGARSYQNRRDIAVSTDVLYRNFPPMPDGFSIPDESSRANPQPFSNEPLWLYDIRVAAYIGNPPRFRRVGPGANTTPISPPWRRHEPPSNMSPPVAGLPDPVPPNPDLIPYYEAAFHPENWNWQLAYLDPEYFDKVVNRTIDDDTMTNNDPVYVKFDRKALSMDAFRQGRTRLRVARDPVPNPTDDPWAGDPEYQLTWFAPWLAPWIFHDLPVEAPDATRNEEDSRLQGNLPMSVMARDSEHLFAPIDGISEQMVQAALFFNLFTPSIGWNAINPDMEIELRTSPASLRFTYDDLLHDHAENKTPHALESSWGGGIPFLGFDKASHGQQGRWIFSTNRVDSAWGGRRYGGILPFEYMLNVPTAFNTRLFDRLRAHYGSNPLSHGRFASSAPAVIDNRHFVRSNYTPGTHGGRTRLNMLDRGYDMVPELISQMGVSAADSARVANSYRYDLVTVPFRITSVGPGTVGSNPMPGTIDFQGGDLTFRFFHGGELCDETAKQSGGGGVAGGEEIQVITVNIPNFTHAPAESGPNRRPVIYDAQSIEDFRYHHGGQFNEFDTLAKDSFSFLERASLGFDPANPFTGDEAIPTRVSRLDTVNASPTALGRFAQINVHNRPSPYGVGDVVQSVEITHGDARLVAGKREIARNEHFAPHRHYGSRAMAHSVTNSVGSGYFGAAIEDDYLIRYNLRGEGGNFAPYRGRAPLPFGVSRSQEVQHYGDFDNGAGLMIDGPYINKPDEGNTHSLQTRFQRQLTGYWEERRNYGEYPYFNRDWLNEAGGPSYFSPNRIVSGPGMFGSLPTGVLSDRPWQTLLFRPDMSNGGEPGFMPHPGANTPPDHLIMDLFWMPVVEPYAISEPLSTGGKINLNYQIVPFLHIQRNTALRGVFRSEFMMCVPNRWHGDYKHNHGRGRGYHWRDRPFAGELQGKRLRAAIRDSATLEQFEDRFNNGMDIFKSATEICEIHLIPEEISSRLNLGDRGSVGSYTPTLQQMESGEYWRDHAVVGDNARERPYTNIHQRITTKSNTFTVHYRAQVIQQARRDNDAEYETWSPDLDRVRAEYRGSSIVERFVNPNDPRIPDFPNDPLKSLDDFYEFRVVNPRRFAP